jgi:hypothetical protein
VSAGWVAATVRGRDLLHRVVGPTSARAMAAALSWPDARDTLGGTFYGAQLPADADRTTARRAAAAATTWQFRVLAGWLPPAATGLARLAAAPMEIANIEHHLAHFDGLEPPAPLPLGSLAVAWPRVVAATSGQEVRAALQRSVWGDPGGDDRIAIALGLRVAWARRVMRSTTAARPWAQGTLAVLIAREKFAFDRPIREVTGRNLDVLVGTHWRAATTLADLAERLPDSANWALDDIGSPADLWRAELAVVERVGSDARPLAASGRYGRETVIAIMALLLVDLWRVTAAVEAAGRGPAGAEVFDAVAS